MRRFFSEKTEPEAFYGGLADDAVASLDVPLAGARVLDLGSGPGYYARALTAAGADVIPIDLDDLGSEDERAAGALLADGGRLPFPAASFDGVFCSNMLEHTPRPEAVLVEIERVVRPGGWGWVSWTNWYSPWGGHAITPLHYLGPRAGLAVWRRLFGEPKGRNLPFGSLWPVHIGRMLDSVRRRPHLRLTDAFPRYYPGQRWILRVPVLREVATWNCVLVVERTGRPHGG